MNCDGVAQAGIAQIAIDQQGLGAEMGEQRCEFETVDLPSLGKTETTPMTLDVRSPSLRSAATLTARNVSEKLDKG